MPKPTVDAPWHHMMQAHRRPFLDARIRELETLQKSQDFMTLEKMLHDWASFSQPYGFSGLSSLAKQGLSELGSYGKLSKQFISQVEGYLHTKDQELGVELNESSPLPEESE